MELPRRGRSLTISSVVWIQQLELDGQTDGRTETERLHSVARYKKCIKTPKQWCTNLVFCVQVLRTPTRLRCKRVTSTPLDFPSAAIVEEPNNFSSYDTVEGFRALFTTAALVKDFDESSSAAKVYIVVQRTVADVLTTPVTVVIFINYEQPRKSPHDMLVAVLSLFISSITASHKTLHHSLW